VIYEQLQMPIVANRDVTVKVTATHDRTSGVIEIHFASAPEEGPPEQAKYVRIQYIKGGWTLTPTRDGGAAVTYAVACNPGGTLPAWLTNAAQQEATPKLLKAMLERVKEKHPTP
jgi:hypothetical protein